MLRLIALYCQCGARERWGERNHWRRARKYKEHVLSSVSYKKKRKKIKIKKSRTTNTLHHYRDKIQLHTLERSDTIPA